MTTKQKITKPITPPTSIDEDIPQASSNLNNNFDPWDFLGSDMYTYQKLLANMNNLKPAVQIAILDGSLKVPNVVDNLINRETIANLPSTESFFDFPNGKIAAYALNKYNVGLEEHEQAYKFVSHLLLTNLFFNIKELFYLEEASGVDPNNWVWRPVTGATIAEFKNLPNSFYIMKLDLSEDTKTILEEFGFDISRSGFSCHHNHATPQSQYFIFSTENISLSQYYNLEPETRNDEPEIVYNQSFFNSIDNFDLSIDREQATFSYTNSMLSPEELYSYKTRKPNSDIFTEVNYGDDDVPR